MSTFRFFVSLAYGFLFFYAFMAMTASYIERGYIGQQLQAGNMGPAFNWLGACILVGIAGFVVGLFGKLPGTK